MGETLIVLVILIVSSAMMAMIKKNIFMKVYNSLYLEDYENFFKYVDSKIACAMMPIYTREILKFSVYIKKDDEQAVTNQFNQMIKMKLKKYQLKDVLIRSFNYYTKQKKKNKCQKILNKMNEILAEEELHKYQRHYDVVMNDSTKYISEIENSVAKHRGKMKGYLEYLLAKSYQTKNNQKEYLKYLNLAMEDYQTNGQELEQCIQVI